ncbi:MAG: hypothetical protein JNM18_25195 [Planctomycetaceae bacterium]|nr:hypothetical protein [Planctomycetaceae bacterium]
MKTEPPEWFRNKPSTLSYHLNHPEIDAETYTQIKRIEYGKRLMSMKRIYFDTKFWVHFCDVVLGNPCSSHHVYIFEKLTKLRLEGVAISPIGYSVFSELLRQSDPKTRIATAKAIDALSDGACIQSPIDLLKQEVLHFLARHWTPRRDIGPVAHTVWTKVAFVTGDRFLHAPSMPLHQREALHKSMDDLAWSITLEEIMSSSGVEEDGDSTEALALFAKELTTGKQDAARDSDCYDKLLLEEIAGGLEPCLEDLGEVMSRLVNASGTRSIVSQEDKMTSGRMLRNLICQLFKAKKIGTELPHIHIGSALHAAMRIDKARTYKQGDCEDFRHAATALPYYDAFCTEKSLKHLVCNSPLNFDKLYSTAVLCKEEEVVALIDDLGK